MATTKEPGITNHTIISEERGISNGQYQEKGGLRTTGDEEDHEVEPPVRKYLEPTVLVLTLMR
jgi:hypothetical protein